MRKPSPKTRLSVDAALARKVEATRPSAYANRILGNNRVNELMVLMNASANCDEYREFKRGPMPGEIDLSDR